MEADPSQGMITPLINLLEVLVLLVFVTFLIRFLAVLMVVVFTGIHPEKKAWYMRIFHVKKQDL